VWFADLKLVSEISKLFFSIFQGLNFKRKKCKGADHEKSDEEGGGGGGGGGGGVLPNVNKREKIREKRNAKKKYLSNSATKIGTAEHLMFLIVRP
jgi:hypothetical protein